MPAMSVGNRNNQSGAALIEFAFVLFPLLLLTIGTLLYGLVFVTQQAMAYAAQGGADALVQLDPNAEAFGGSVKQLCNSPVADTVAQRRVTDLLPNALLDPDNVEVSFATDTTEIKGCSVEVTNGFFLHIPLLPLPDSLRGVGFVPIQVQ